MSKCRFCRHVCSGFWLKKNFCMNTLWIELLLLPRCWYLTGMGRGVVIDWWMDVPSTFSTTKRILAKVWTSVRRLCGLAAKICSKGNVVQSCCGFEIFCGAQRSSWVALAKWLALKPSCARSQKFLRTKHCSTKRIILGMIELEASCSWHFDLYGSGKEDFQLRAPLCQLQGPRILSQSTVVVSTNSAKGLFGSFVRARGATKHNNGKLLCPRIISICLLICWYMCKNGRKAILAKKLISRVLDAWCVWASMLLLVKTALSFGHTRWILMMVLYRQWRRFISFQVLLSLIETLFFFLSVVVCLLLSLVWGFVFVFVCFLLLVGLCFRFNPVRSHLIGDASTSTIVMKSVAWGEKPFLQETLHHTTLLCWILKRLRVQSLSVNFLLWSIAWYLVTSSNVISSTIPPKILKLEQLWHGMPESHHVPISKRESDVHKSVSCTAVLTQEFVALNLFNCFWMHRFHSWKKNLHRFCLFGSPSSIVRSACYIENFILGERTRAWGNDAARKNGDFPMTGNKLCRTWFCVCPICWLSGFLFSFHLMFSGARHRKALTSTREW